MNNHPVTSGKLFRRLQLLPIIFIVAVLSISCGDVRKIQYMQGDFDTTKLSRIVYKEPGIQKGDLLAITVYSDNQLASSFYNQPTSTLAASSASGSGITNSSGSGYLVDDLGTIRLYELGIFSVEGLTRKQVAEKMVKAYIDKNVLKNPYVEIRFLNFKITLIGEFNRPGVYTLPSEKVSVLDAIGLAGDLNTYARKDNVLIIREVNGTRQFGRLNLLGTDFFLSPYYYLQQNDMIVIDATKNKAAANDQVTVRNVSLAASVLTTIAIFINIFKK